MEAMYLFISILCELSVCKGCFLSSHRYQLYYPINIYYGVIGESILAEGVLNIMGQHYHGNEVNLVQCTH